MLECRTTREGLMVVEAEQRNALRSPRENTNRLLLSWRFLRKRFRSSFTLILLGSALISFFLGDRIDAWLILSFIFINATLETVQEYQSERAAQLLAEYLVTFVRVRREGKEARIPSEELVVGDVVLFQVGDRLTADMRVIAARGLLLDESVITGESAVVAKTMTPLKQEPAEMYAASNIVFAGTVVTGGSGEGVVFAVGQETQFGETASLAEHTERETVFEKGIARFSRFLLRLVVATIALVFVANVAIRGEKADIAELLVFSLVLAVSVIPEALPVITTVALSRGSIRLAKKKVIVKRLSAIEDLGSIDILCTDKTGTLTENKMKVAAVRADDEKKCVHMALLGASEAFGIKGEVHDPFDRALLVALPKAQRQTIMQARRMMALPFDPELRRNAVLVDEGKGVMLIVRGAPEKILAVSSGVSVSEKREWIRFAAEEGKKGRRVLAVALKPMPQAATFSLRDERSCQFLGMIAFEDPLKKSAIGTIAHAKALRIGVKIITGDSREVAESVGRAVGLVERPEQVMTAEELFLLPYEERLQAAEKAVVIARVAPQQKFDIIQLLESKHAVGFLGEGINDAPALKLANVAIVVDGAADVARESADVILLRGDLETVIEGIREGRKIFANILKYLKVTLTSNFGNFYSVALSSLFLPFVPLLPVQILLLDLLSDFPMIAIATDTVDTEELVRPREYNIHSIVLASTLLGTVSSLFDFALFAIYMHVSPGALQTAWFLLSACTEVILIYSLRTRRSCFKAHPASFALGSLSVIILSVVVVIPFLPIGTDFFRFVLPTWSMLGIVGSLALAYFLMTEIVKRWYYTHIFQHDSERKTV